MIIENGYIQAFITHGGGIENGKPIPSYQTMGEKVACNIRTVRNNLHGKSVDGIFRQTDYEVLIEGTEAPVFGATKIALTDNRGRMLGEFFVQDIQYLDHVSAVKIDVAHAD